MFGIGQLLKLGSKVADKFALDNDRINGTIKILDTTKDLDMEHAKNTIARNNFNYKNPRSWLEGGIVAGFLLSAVVFPIINSVLGTSFKGMGGEINDLMYTMLGLGGYRLAEKVLPDKK
ncbi:hypothetical protein ABSA28_01203 [Candidatus Hepatincolaceae symbiont of Richtersius coronifer]